MTAPTARLRTDTYTLSDGRTLSFATGGDPSGRPVIVHHGTPGSRLFGALLAAPATEAGVRILVPDRPGYGRSSPPLAGWTWRNWPDDLAELLDAESIDRAGIVGFSGGGPFALAAANGGWATRVGLISTVVPPAENALSALGSIPFALRIVFRLSKALTSVVGPTPIVSQYTDRSVSDSVAEAVEADFHEALRRDARAVERESRAFASASFDPTPPDVPVRVWHGTRDENTPLSPVRTLVREFEATLTTVEADHLGTLLDRQRDALVWIGADW